VKETSGRKIFLEGTMSDVNDRTHYADATALFINMKTAPKIGNGEDSKGSMAAGFSHSKVAEEAAQRVTDWHTSPRYDALCAAINIE
jgi:hypothetical protein